MPICTIEQLGNRILTALDGSHLNVDSLATTVFTTPETILKYEDGAALPSPDMLNRIAQTLNITPTVLKNGTDDERIANCGKEDFQHIATQIAEGILGSVIKLTTKSNPKLSVYDKDYDRDTRFDEKHQCVSSIAYFHKKQGTHILTSKVLTRIYKDPINDDGPKHLLRSRLEVAVSIDMIENGFAGNKPVTLLQNYICKTDAIDAIRIISDIMNAYM